MMVEQRYVGWNSWELISWITRQRHREWQREQPFETSKPTPRDTLPQQAIPPKPSQTLPPSRNPILKHMWLWELFLFKSPHSIDTCVPEIHQQWVFPQVIPNMRHSQHFRSQSSWWWVRGSLLLCSVGLQRNRRWHCATQEHAGFLQKLLGRQRTWVMALYEMAKQDTTLNAAVTWCAPECKQPFSVAVWPPFSLVYDSAFFTTQGHTELIFNI